MRCVSLLLFAGSCKMPVIGGDLNMQNRNGVRTAQRFDYIAQLEFRASLCSPFVFGHRASANSKVKFRNEKR